MAFDAKEFYRQQQTDVVETQSTEPIVPIIQRQDNAVAEKTLAKDTEDLVKMGIKAAVINKFQNDENLIKKTDETAGKMIDNKLDQAKNETELDAKTAIFQNNVDACALIGVDEKTVPKWVINGARVIQAILYAIWLVVGGILVAPVVFLGMKIKVVIKKTWVAMLLGVIIYLSILIVPIIVGVIKK